MIKTQRENIQQGRQGRMNVEERLIDLAAVTLRLCSGLIPFRQEV
jgi:hypothetical protein